jgi:zinc protease
MFPKGAAMFKKIAFCTLFFFSYCCGTTAFSVVEKKEAKGEGMKEKEKKEKGKPLMLSQSSAQTARLDNGLEIVVVEDHAVPRVSIGILYKVGACDDPENLMGISHMTEHMFFHGSEKYPHIDENIGRLGGHLNAYTSFDYTMYVTDVPTEARTKVFDIEADRMKNFCLKQKDIFENEKKAVFEERLMSVENVPLGLIEEYVRLLISPQHPYGKEVVGSRKNIQAYTAEAVMAHYKTWYKPGNAAVIVVGDVHAKDVFLEVKKAFGTIADAPVPPRSRLPNNDKGISQEITVKTDKVEAPRVFFIYNAPHLATDGFLKIVAFRLGLRSLLGNRQKSFHKEIVKKKKLASTLGYELYSALDPYPLRVKATLVKGITSSQYLKFWNQKLAQILKNGIDEKDFQRAKKQLEHERISQKEDNPRDRRDDFCQLAMGFSVEQIEGLLQTAQSIKKETVDEVLREFLSQPPQKIITFLPEPQKKPAAK